MSIENPDNQFRWRERLENLHHVQTDAFSKDAAWDKLHGRLRKTQNERKIGWYWIAAACSALVFIFALLNTRSSAPKSPNDQIVTQTQKSDKSILPTNQDHANNHINVVVPREKTIAAIHTSDHRNLPVKAVEVFQGIPPNDTVAYQLKMEGGTQPLQISNNDLTVIQVLPARKRFNVVHINELGDPVTASPDMARRIDKHSFKFKLANEESIVNSQVVSQTTGFTIFKTKPSSN